MRSCPASHRTGNVRIERLLPFDRLLPKVDVMVTNGGYGGIQFALANGVPLVAAGRTEEKVEVNARVAWSGVGTDLKTEIPTPEAVGEAVRRVLSEPSYRQRAKELQRSYRRHDAARESGDLLEELAGVQPAEVTGTRGSTGGPRPSTSRSAVPVPCSTAVPRGAPVTFQSRLLAWSQATRRDLPWRRTRDPWAVLVSEAMLQQTQVTRVVPKYREFLERFPAPRACADAPAGEVIRLWEGLGYNRRAVHLHGAAQALVEQHGGDVPDDLDDLLALPGVGPYTARAVLAFAFERDHGVVDTNAARVLARAVAGRSMTSSEAQSLADELVPAGQGWAWNQAVLDLGATVCTKRSPRCEGCPVQDHCLWALAGWSDPDPADGTAGMSGRQPTFAGSDRQGRGRLVDALRGGAVALDRVPDAAGWPDQPDRARRVADGLVRDGLAEVVDGVLTLPA